MIRFPRMHIAASVVNRILNARDELESSAAPAVPSPAVAPDPPDPTIQGAEIDLTLRQPAPVMPPADDGPDGPAANTLEATLSGGRPLQGLLDTISGQ